MNAPFFKEPFELVQKAQKWYSSFLTIGWDIAITFEGPILVEENYEWGVESLQGVHYAGEKALFKKTSGIETSHHAASITIQTIT